jgi:hypothetical protein
MVLENPDRKQAYLYCQFINEVAIRRAVAAGKNCTTAQLRAYPNIVDEDTVARLTDEDWLNPAKLVECVTINEEPTASRFNFTSEIIEWLKSLGYSIEESTTLDGYGRIIWIRW